MKPRGIPRAGAVPASAVLLTLMVLCLCTGSAMAALQIHPENPHYFRDTVTGEAVMITSYGTVAPSSSHWSEEEVGPLAANGVSWARVWHMIPWAGSDALWPWGRSSVPGAYMGGTKFDLDTWDPVYWQHLHSCLGGLNSAGVYAEIMLFDRCGMSASDSRWGSNPWASDNNINGLETPGGAGSGVPEFYDYPSKPNLRAQQERYVTKLIDETICYPNMIYEIENEHAYDSNPAWAAHYARFVKSYLSTRYPLQQRLVSYSSLMADLDLCYMNPDIDIINKHYDYSLESDPSQVHDYLVSRWGYGKAMNIDEFANGVADFDILRRECWTIVTSGGNFHIEDALPEARPYDVVGNIERFKQESGWDFIDSAPDSSAIMLGGGYCMSAKGTEYVCYFPAGGAKLVSLPSGTYTARWWDPRSGGFRSNSSLSLSGGINTVSTPDTYDWVLHITKSVTQPSVTPWPGYYYIMPPVVVTPPIAVIPYPWPIFWSTPIWHDPIVIYPR